MLETLKEQTKQVQEQAKFGLRVKFLRDGKQVHKGVIIKVTTIGATIYNPDKNSGDTIPEFAEWFPFHCSNGGMTLLKS